MLTSAGATSTVVPVFSGQQTPCVHCTRQLLTATLRATTRIFDRNRYRLQRRLNQAKRHTHVMQPGLQFVFHKSPLGLHRRPLIFGRFVQIIVLSPTQCLPEVNELLANFAQMRLMPIPEVTLQALRHVAGLCVLQFNPGIEVGAHHAFAPHQPGGCAVKRRL